MAFSLTGCVNFEKLLISFLPRFVHLNWGSDLYLIYRAVKSSKRDKVCKQFRIVLGTYKIFIKVWLFLSLLVRDLCVGVVGCDVVYGTMCDVVVTCVWLWWPAPKMSQSLQEEPNLCVLVNPTSLFNCWPRLPVIKHILSSHKLESWGPYTFIHQFIHPFNKYLSVYYMPETRIVHWPSQQKSLPSENTDSSWEIDT